MQKTLYICLLLSIIISSGYASAWTLKNNKHGIALKSSHSNLYLGKDCDALSTIYGKGYWGWDKEKVSVIFDKKKYSLNIGLVYPKPKCHNSNIVYNHYNPKHVEVVIPKNKCALIVASRKTMSDVRKYIDENITNTRYLNIYKSNNDWYVISIGFLKKSQKNSIIKNWKKIGKIPSDALCSSGSKYLYEVSPSKSLKKSLNKKLGLYSSRNTFTHKKNKR